MPLSHPDLTGGGILPNGAPILGNRRTFPGNGGSVAAALTGTAIYGATFFHPDELKNVISVQSTANCLAGMVSARGNVIRFTNVPTPPPGAAPGGITSLFPDRVNGAGFFMLGGGSNDIWAADSCDPATAVFTNLQNATNGFFNASGFCLSTKNAIVGGIGASNPNAGVSIDNGATWTNGQFLPPTSTGTITARYTSRNGEIVAFGSSGGILLVDDPITFAGFAGFSTAFTVGLNGDFNDAGTTLVFSGGGTGAIHVAQTPWAGFSTVPFDNNPFATSAAAGQAIDVVRYIPKLEGWLITCNLNTCGLLLESDLTNIIPGIWTDGATAMVANFCDIDADGELYITGNDVSIANQL